MDEIMNRARILADFQAAHAVAVHRYANEADYPYSKVVSLSAQWVEAERLLREAVRANLPVAV